MQIPLWSYQEARVFSIRSSGWIPIMADIATLLLDTATSACRTSECPQTFGVKGLTNESLLSADIQMHAFWSFSQLTLSVCGEEKISWL